MRSIDCAPVPAGAFCLVRHRPGPLPHTAPSRTPWPVPRQPVHEPAHFEPHGGPRLAEATQATVRTLWRKQPLLSHQHLHDVQPARPAARTQQYIDLRHPCHEVSGGLGGLRVESACGYLFGVCIAILPSTSQITLWRLLLVIMGSSNRSVFNSCLRPPYKG